MLRNPTGQIYTRSWRAQFPKSVNRFRPTNTSHFHPAKIFMGDTGSIFLGGVLASTAIYLKNPLILVIIAIIPVLETLSDILQVIHFRRTGKRLFKMAPLHHHFELSGWRENRVVAVFSIVTLLASIVGIFSI